MSSLAKATSPGEGMNGRHLGQHRAEQVCSVAGLAAVLVLLVEAAVAPAHPTAVVHVVEAVRAVVGQGQAGMYFYCRMNPNTSIMGFGNTKTILGTLTTWYLHPDRTWGKLLKSGIGSSSLPPM